MNIGTDYTAFLRAKVQLAESFGFEIDAAEVNPLLKPEGEPC